MNPSATVLVAALAAAAGWGFSKVNPDGATRQRLRDGKQAFPQYASKKEMELVRPKCAL